MQLGLQCANLLAHGGRGQSDLIACAHEAAMAGDGQKGFQVADRWHGSCAVFGLLVGASILKNCFVSNAIKMAFIFE